ncbi:hypothetical protein [Amycolatopsis sp. TNS106]|uniref:hypothetical protein n=1 Tax=Amycolatopsis sp. TNS106 TaxID=2861750 RepID=UPI001C593212|nr:hypothetical protein [Amycolatopsis sp. TNS106]QXV56874.1 hypothetical protein CVV72_07510 [Amycolatopsis sp. TNS106]
MEEFPDPSGPPYPYKYPLPAEAKAEHQRAVEYFRRKYAFWDSMMMPSISVGLVAAGVLSEDDEGYLSVPVLLGVLVVTGVLMALIGLRKDALADKRDKHVNLLKTYRVLPHEIDGSASATLPSDFDTNRDHFGAPLPGKADPCPRAMPDSTPAIDKIPGENPYNGMIRLSPPKPRPESGP